MRDSRFARHWQSLGAMIKLSAKTEIAQHEQDDHNGADDPDDLVHDVFPLLARVGSKAGRPAHTGIVPREPI